jgi:hypothetical protein
VKILFALKLCLDARAPATSHLIAFRIGNNRGAQQPQDLFCVPGKLQEWYVNINRSVMKRMLLGIMSPASSIGDELLGFLALDSVLVSGVRRQSFACASFDSVLSFDTTPLINVPRGVQVKRKAGAAKLRDKAERRLKVCSQLISDNCLKHRGSLGVFIEA